MNPQDKLLSQLRDIHSAPELPWWPPAPGWWVLAVLLIIALFFLMRRLQLRYRAQKRRQQLLGFIEKVTRDYDPGKSPQDYLSGLNRIMKIVAIRAFPDTPCAHLQGHEWADFLKEKMARDERRESLDVMATGPYQPHAAFEAGELVSMARQWVQKYG